MLEGLEANMKSSEDTAKLMVTRGAEDDTGIHFREDTHLKGHEQLDIFNGTAWP